MFDLKSAVDDPPNRELAATNFPTPDVLFRCPLTPGPPHPICAYPALAGVGPDAARIARRDEASGVIGHDWGREADEVKDGASSTLALLESGRDLGPWAAGGPPTVRALDPAGVPIFGPGRPFGGRHPGGANAAFAGGSVRFLRDGIAPAVLAALATANGNEAVPADW